MLVAVKELRVFGGLVKPGEPVPFPEKWDRIALQSNINLGWIKDVPPEEVAAPVPAVKAKSKAKPKRAKA